jgi:alkylhydroperoxidase/carboxymuconolactone decarboxylase family protein YurZ
MSDVSDILARAALALRDINQHELADIVTLLALLATTEQIAGVRGALLRVLAA